MTTGTISYSLFGTHRNYVMGALLQSPTRDLVYPGWSIRVYHDVTVPEIALERLKTQGVELVDMTGIYPAGQRSVRMMWRFEACGDRAPTLSRDTDSRLTAREADAVNRWLDGDRMLMTMHDSTSHGISPSGELVTPVMGGMWGIRSELPGIHRACRRYAEAHAHALTGAGLDQEFLHTVLWPRLSESCWRVAFREGLHVDDVFRVPYERAPGLLGVTWHVGCQDLPSPEEIEYYGWQDVDEACTSGAYSG